MGLNLNLEQMRINNRELPEEVYLSYQRENLIDPITQEVLLDPVQLNCSGSHVVSDFIQERLNVENRLRCHFCREPLDINDSEAQPAVDERIREIWRQNQDRIGFTIEEYRERVLQEFEPNAEAIADYNAEMNRQNHQYFIQRFVGEFIRAPAFLLSDPEFNINNQVGLNNGLFPRRNLVEVFNQEEVPNHNLQIDRAAEGNDLDVMLNREEAPNHNPPIHRAVEDNDLDRLLRLLEEGADVNYQNDDDETPLHIAARMGNLQCIQLLIRHDANVNALDEVGNTPLHFASNLLSANALIENGADINRLNNRRDTPAFKALRNNHFDIAVRLINEGCVINISGFCHDSLLHVAAERNAENVIRALLDRHCATDSRNIRGWTPLFVAIHNGNLEAFNALVDASDINILDPDQNTALHIAVSTLQVNREIIVGLLNREMDRYAQNQNGELPLIIARRLNLPQEIIELLT